MNTKSATVDSSQNDTQGGQSVPQADTRVTYYVLITITQCFLVLLILRRIYKYCKASVRYQSNISNQATSILV